MTYHAIQIEDIGKELWFISESEIDHNLVRSFYNLYKNENKMNEFADKMLDFGIAQFDVAS